FSGSKDSITYSFATQADDLMEGVVNVPLRVMGRASDKDRTVTFEFSPDSTTAIMGSHFEITPVIIPAGQFFTNAAIKVKRTADLKQNEVRLWVIVKESADLAPGIPNTP